MIAALSTPPRILTDTTAAKIMLYDIVSPQAKLSCRSHETKICFQKSTAASCMKQKMHKLKPTMPCVYKRVKHTLKILQHFMQEFQSMLGNIVDTRRCRANKRVDVVMST